MLASASFAFLNFSLPLRVDALGGGGLAVGALYAVFTAVLLAGRPLVGRGLDRFGRRPFLVAAMAMYVIAMMLFSAAEGFVALIGARAVQGVAAALLWVSVRTWIADSVAHDVRAEALGRITERSVQGSIVGAALAFTAVGTLGVAVAWGMSFALFAMCAALALLLVLRGVPVSGPPQVITDATPSSERTRFDPMLVAVFASAATSVAVFPFVLLALAERFGDDPARVAQWMLPVAAVMGFLPSRAGRLADRHGARRIVPPALLLAAIASGALAFAREPLYAVLALAAVVAGTAAADTALAARAGGRDSATRGRRYGWFELATGLGGVVGPLLAGALHEGLAPQAPFLLAAATALLALVVASACFHLEGRSAESGRDRS
jgi:MFS family permease